MKKIAIVMLLAFSLTLCACSNQTENNKEDASQGVSSALGFQEASSEAVSGETSSNTTLPSAEGNENKPSIRFDDGEDATATTNNSGVSQTTENVNDPTLETVTEGSEGFELPKVPIN